ncbi:hypothetical protein NDA01_25340 [Trichocoleus desertorum AS-A10]
MSSDHERSRWDAEAGVVACFPKGTSISVIQSHSNFPGRPLGNEWLPQ